MVQMLSMCSQTNLVDTRKTDTDGNAVTKPALIREYNLHIGYGWCRPCQSAAAQCQPTPKMV